MAETPPTDFGREKIFTTGEAAQVCKVSQQTIIRCFDSGRLTGFRVPGSKFRRIPREELIRFMNANDIPLDLIEGGTKVLPFTEDLLIGAKAASEQMLADSAAADPAYKKVHEHWRAFREESFRWFGTAELAYSRFAFGGDR